ncbi:MAG: tRNA pseudouridine(55) synthase TruB [Candidatus Cloacimonetes bacterium]|nr:tRNA pseudouridine(55) synthase TruB [Candidatus Cloacimonadota bacterium]
MNPAPNPDQSGFLLIDKPEGLSSFDVIRALRKISGIRKIGHTGTLDPFATGLMIYCMSRYTRIAYLLEARDKTYHVKLKFGERTDSGDLTGKVIARSEHVVDNTELSALKDYVLGLKRLPVPIYSAVKLDGKRAYTYARQGLDIAIPERETRIYNFEIQSFNFPYLEYICQVSKGTYIRSLSEQIALFLGTLAHTVALRREAIGNITLERSVNLDILAKENWQNYLVDPAYLLSSNQSVICNEEQISTLLMGRTISLSGEDCDDLLVYDSSGRIMSIGKLFTGILSPKINLGY